MDSYDYIMGLLYDEKGKPLSPSKMDNLYQRIQDVVLIYKNHPDWPEQIRDDMRDYVQKCTDLLEKM